MYPFEIQLKSKKLDAVLNYFITHRHDLSITHKLSLEFLDRFPVFLSEPHLGLTVKTLTKDTMRATLRLLQHRQPMIKFIGRRHTPPASQSLGALVSLLLTMRVVEIDHSPAPHPASPTQSLPDSFATYRQKAQQHGPLNGGNSSIPFGAIGSHSGHSLGTVEPDKGEYFDRSELPRRFQRTPWTLQEIEAVESGGASLFK